MRWTFGNHGPERLIPKITLAHSMMLCVLACRLKCLSTSKPQRRGGRLLAALFMLSLWAAVFTLELSPQIHLLLHEDAQNPAHNCLATQFQHQLSLPVLATAIALPAPDLSVAYVGYGGVFQSRPSYDYRLSPSRAPPAV